MPHNSKTTVIFNENVPDVQIQKKKRQFSNDTLDNLEREIHYYLIS